ncbi:UNVERIFIED_CONTAM: cytochrome b [Sesamum calycinum]|uniref:Cytochrome b n=1 Tax=Sesamum calycinum TaxID=2727403 RepID=A0AAW2JVB5_9LAMI
MWASFIRVATCYRKDGQSECRSSKKNLTTATSKDFTWLIYSSMYVGFTVFKSWIGCQPVEAPFVTIGLISPFLFFLFFAITPIPGRVGRGIPNSYTEETDHT